MVRQRLARLVLRATRWRTVGEVPPAAVIVGAPHTSNWDFVLMLLVMWQGAATPRALVKKELFRGPAGWLLTSCGCIPVDRDNSADLVRGLAARTRGDEPFLLVLAAEGTRRKTEYWRSGFYRIAERAGLPVALSFVDGPTRTVGFGPTLRLSGDVAADMDLVRAFYADKRGLRPALKTEPRLREETAARPDPSRERGGEAV